MIYLKWYSVLLSPAEVRLYLLVLEEQGRHKRILEVVTGELGRWASVIVGVVIRAAALCCKCGLVIIIKTNIFVRPLIKAPPTSQEVGYGIQRNYCHMSCLVYRL